jgi:esterase
MGELARTLTAPDGATIAYRLWRPGPPRRVVVLLHGLASNMTRWSELVARTALKDSWDLLRPDLRGYAGSLSRGRVGLDVWCADLAAVLEREACPPAVVVGHCLGAAVAVELARRHPHRVAALVLVDPIVRGALAGSLRYTPALRPLVVPVTWLLRGLAALGLHRRRLATLDLEQMDRETRAAMATHGAASLLHRYASPLDDLRSTPVGIYLQSLVAVSRGLPDLGGVRVPILALLAAGGLLGDPAITGRVLAAHPSCRVRRIDAEHWIPTERPDELRQALEGFCGEVAAGGSPGA